MSCKEPALRKSFSVQRNKALCAVVYGFDDYLATGLSNGTVMLLPAKPENHVRKWIGHRGPVTCMEVCVQDGHLVTGGADGIVRLWTDQDEQEQSVALSIGESEIVSIATSSKNDKLLVVNGTGEPQLWDTRHCAKVMDLESAGGCVKSVSLSMDGVTALTGSSNGEFHLFDLRTGRVVHVANAGAPVTATSIKQRGALAAIGCANGNVILWDSRAHTALNDSPLHRGSVSSVAFHPSKPMLLSSSSDGTIAVCDASTRGLLYTLECHTAMVYSAQWSVEGTTFSSVGDDDRVVMWDEPVVEQRREHVVTRDRPSDSGKPGLLVAPTAADTYEEEMHEDPSTMQVYTAMMNKVAGQIGGLTQTLSRIEARMSGMEDQITRLESQKREQAKRVLQVRQQSGDL